MRHYPAGLARVTPFSFQDLEGTGMHCKTNWHAAVFICLVSISRSALPHARREKRERHSLI